jgi:hypothetical protein
MFGNDRVGKRTKRDFSLTPGAKSGIGVSSRFSRLRFEVQ